LPEANPRRAPIRPRTRTPPRQPAGTHLTVEHRVPQKAWPHEQMGRHRWPTVLGARPMNARSPVRIPRQLPGVCPGRRNNSVTTNEQRRSDRGRVYRSPRSPGCRESSTAARGFKSQRYRHRKSPVDQGFFSEYQGEEGRSATEIVVPRWLESLLRNVIVLGSCSLSAESRTESRRAPYRRSIRSPATMTSAATIAAKPTRMVVRGSTRSAAPIRRAGIARPR
jgi:hypothetical protein